jgi:hypothetical protein
LKCNAQDWQDLQDQVIGQANVLSVFDPVNPENPVYPVQFGFGSGIYGNTTD